MTTAFQYVFDNAESISINRRAVTAQTQSRGGLVRTVSRGGQIWRFDVQLPAGPRWSDVRPYIESIDAADRYTPGTVSLSAAGYQDWLPTYQGNSANYTGFSAAWTQGASSCTLTVSPSTASGYKFRRGDIIQLGSAGRVYSVTQDVAYNASTVYVNRPILDATSAGTAILVADDVTWTVVCVEMPQWTIFARNQVSWSGPFRFAEYML